MVVMWSRPSVVLTTVYICALFSNTICLLARRSVNYCLPNEVITLIQRSFNYNMSLFKWLSSFIIMSH